MQQAAMSGRVCDLPAGHGVTNDKSSERSDYSAAPSSACSDIHMLRQVLCLEVDHQRIITLLQWPPLQH